MAAIVTPHYYQWQKGDTIYSVCSRFYVQANYPTQDDMEPFMRRVNLQLATPIYDWDLVTVGIQVILPYNN